MVDRKLLERSVLEVLTVPNPGQSPGDFLRQVFEERRLPVAEQNPCLREDEAINRILNREVLLLVDGEPRMLALAITSFPKRSIEEAPNEIVIRGPREAFVEDLETNLTMLRRRIKSPSFKVEFMQFGKQTQTQTAITYIQGICQDQLVAEVKRRLADIEIDGVLGTSYLQEMIEDNPYSPFPQLQYTERPDLVTAALLEGRIVIQVDGTPIAILAPVTIFTLLQSPEDYYQRYVAASWIRYIRYIFTLISLLLPSFYVAVTTFHPDIIPERLLVTIASSREVVPFPALLEAFIMELSFEALREASLRIPKAIGQAVSIIGALIIGTAAVEAGIVSAAMVIIVSLTGIASFIIPHYDLGLAFRLLRFPIMILAGAFGLIGIACGLLLLYIHMLELRSFGVPYMAPLAPLRPNDLKDTLGRAPWWAMRTRPSFEGAHGRQSKAARAWAKPSEEGE
ncbi:spore germination protein [Paenibacillus sp. J31TS4]|uniref:spore germination protein n=1 Tax=Paenibacillus sp. J31TS4 TaxID=2807195 RepID=UPI001AFCF5E3|nr:spore germination protein [Paenibacillus sp. J31TS4]